MYVYIYVYKSHIKWWIHIIIQTGKTRSEKAFPWEVTDPVDASLNASSYKNKTNIRTSKMQTRCDSC